ncbi:hypothetical protein WR25_22418 [Diploscapter pachys]|uniref:Uncharacterized protein n=1 Tax=Diploscapter pachys TaxID=2018661 RepID=A0A2A2LUA4_9BILA|nr:hypothetical protein WR25_22418 [Diploscapter pachys]
MRIPDLNNMTAFELAYAAPNPLTGGKAGFEAPVGGKYLIIPTLTPDEADKLTGFIYIVSQKNPPTKFFDITSLTPNTVSLGAGESAAFFVAAQTAESTTTTPGNPETTPSSTTKATPVVNGIYHSLVSNFQPPGSNSIIRIYNGTDDNSQELYSNAATPNSIISSIYLTVPFFKVSSSSQIYFSYQLTEGSPPTNISVETLPASGLVSSNDFPNDGTSEYTRIEMKNAFYQWVNISVSQRVQLQCLKKDFIRESLGKPPQFETI